MKPLSAPEERVVETSVPPRPKQWLNRNVVGMGLTSLLSDAGHESAPVIVNAVVEIPSGSSNKYEYDMHLGVFRLDRVLYSPVHYPVEYGFIPGTLADDGDPLDILILISRPTFPGCLLVA